MSQQKLTPGTFCWIDFATPDPDKAKVFYQKIFNWKYHDSPMPDGGNYTIISTADGDGVGGLFQMPDEMIMADVPPHINNYIAVVNADEFVETAKDLGAAVKMEPYDVFDYGRMAILTDPTGAAFSLWQSKSNDDECTMASRETHGMYCWQELMTADVDQAAKFYQQLFGWNYTTMQVDNVDYTLIKVQGCDIGGMMMLPSDMKHTPSHWNTYFTVTNVDETIKAIQNNGGDVIMGPQDIPETGRFAMCRAPDHTIFCPFQYLGNSN